MLERVSLNISGDVQGKGYRPLLYRKAAAHSLSGWVRNSPAGIEMEIEGCQADVSRFLQSLGTDNECETLGRFSAQPIQPLCVPGFVIRPSALTDSPGAGIPVDTALCVQCRDELSSPGNRRYRYPFTSCASCGPRYTILAGTPFDRERTSMRAFSPCPACHAEYVDPDSRRFHAQTISCSDCGPQLTLRDAGGDVLAEREGALRSAIDKIVDGQIVAVKSIGGYHLVVDATNIQAVQRLRKRKRRPDKPFALTLQTVEDVSLVCQVSPAEASALCSPAAPIVLLQRLRDVSPGLRPADDVAMGSPYWGCMLPAMPLHHLMMLDCGGRPLVMTSGNIAGHPIVTDNDRAVNELGTVADVILCHDLPILHPCDDSVVQVIDGRQQVLRIGRGMAPMVIAIDEPIAHPVVGVGAHEKNTVALAYGKQILVSQHISAAESVTGMELLGSELSFLAASRLVSPRTAVHDKHLEFASTHFARSNFPDKTHSVQHHHAHVLSCLAEHGVTEPVLGVAWDGSGLGDDGTIWGGEFLRVDGTHCQRLASFRPFPLIGSERAVREPRRSALGLFLEIFGSGGAEIVRRRFSKEEFTILTAAAGEGQRWPWTSSVGRLFDALASTLDLCQVASYDAQAPLALEACAWESQNGRSYQFALKPSGDGRWLVDETSIFEDILHDVCAGIGASDIARGFHEALARVIVDVAKLANLSKVVLTGGVFQNRLLSELAIAGLRQAGFTVLTHGRVPANDGGIAVGQVWYARSLQNSKIGAE